MPEFSNLQFPWRWLIFSGFSVSIIAGNLIGNFKGKVQKSAGILFIPLLIMSFIMILQISFFKKRDLDQWRMHPSAFPPFEYRPVWLNNPKELLPAAEKIKIVKGEGTVDIIDWKSSQRILSTNGDTSLTVTFSTFFYPGWTPLGGIKKLQELCEADHMDEFMSHNVSGQREQLNVRVALQSITDGVILQTNLEKIQMFAPSQAQVGRTGIAMDLGEGVVADFVFTQVFQRLDIITIALPLRGGDLKVVADDFLRYFTGLTQ